MSYDLMVFEPNAAPSQRVEFMEWYRRQAEWNEDHSYDDPAVTTTSLQAWFFDMITSFPALNGPHATDDFDAPNPTDYCIGTSVIYAGFPWPAADSARPATMEFAKKHQVGFFDVSSDDGGIWLPTDSGTFLRVPW